MYFVFCLFLFHTADILSQKHVICDKILNFILLLFSFLKRVKSRVSIKIMHEAKGRKG